MKSKTLKLVVSLAIPQIVGGLGALFTTPAITSWYALLRRPPLNPPNWVFGPVWTTLFVLMGVALYLVWVLDGKSKKSDAAKKRAILVFALQLGLNLLWSLLFFGLHSPGLALIEITVLWAAIIWCALEFYPLSKSAAYLLAPYILWVSFAMYLNYGIWLLN